VYFQLVWPIITCSNISWQKYRFSVIFEFFRIYRSFFGEK
jgi:hypothetical protein